MKVFKKICFGIIVAMLIGYLFVVISPRIFEGFYPFGIKTAVVLTGSMEPTISIDDFVIVKKPDGVVSAGDIVSYREADQNAEVLHRVVRISGNDVITKGDANNTEDKPIKLSQITGVYIGKVEYFGKVISFITKPVVFSIIMVVLLASVFIPRKKTGGRENDKK